jgi:hypothetical protein
MGLLIGGLAAVILVILYEQKGNVSVPIAAMAPAVSTSASGAGTGAPLTSAVTVPPVPTGQMAQAAASLPQFSSAQNPSIIDIEEAPVWNGTAWTCGDGDVAYYDPQTQTVYCVLPGMIPASQSNSAVLQGVGENGGQVEWYDPLTW